MNTITLISGITGVLTVKTDANGTCVDSSSITWHNIALVPKIKFLCLAFRYQWIFIALHVYYSDNSCEYDFGN